MTDTVKDCPKLVECSPEDEARICRMFAMIHGTRDFDSWIGDGNTIEVAIQKLVAKGMAQADIHYVVDTAYVRHLTRIAAWENWHPEAE